MRKTRAQVEVEMREAFEKKLAGQFEKLEKDIEMVRKQSRDEIRQVLEKTENT